MGVAPSVGCCVWWFWSTQAEPIQCPGSCFGAQVTPAAPRGTSESPGWALETQTPGPSQPLTRTPRSTQAALVRPRATVPSRLLRASLCSRPSTAEPLARCFPLSLAGSSAPWDVVCPGGGESDAPGGPPPVRSGAFRQHGSAVRVPPAAAAASSRVSGPGLTRWGAGVGGWGADPPPVSGYIAAPALGLAGQDGCPDKPPSV